jgi:membrane protease YdiL (CAAX protease family)
LRQLSREPDPVLLQGREGRWRWPWALLGSATTGVALLVLSLPAGYFEDLAIRQRWIGGRMPLDAFPLDPARPVTAIDSLLVSLPFLLAPLFTLWAVHGVSWRRAFSYGRGFDWGQFWRAALAYLTLAALGLGLGYVLEPEQHYFPARGFSHVPWLALALGVILVQTIGEDVLFKGYLVRTWGAVLPLRLPLTAAVVALFVAGHLWNEDVRRDLLLNLAMFTVAELVSFAMLFRTQNLAASAGLHWMNNVLTTLVPTVPGQPTYVALLVYVDPVYTAGGSRLTDPLTQIAGVVGFSVLLILLLWRRSPFHLPKAPQPEAGAATAAA